jgi:hypothetical protein
LNVWPDSADSETLVQAGGRVQDDVGPPPGATSMAATATELVLSPIESQAISQGMRRLA